MTSTTARDWITIGELARRSGLSPDLLRAWERRYGLLRPRRTASNRRLYSRADEARIRLMQRFLGDGMPAARAAEMVCAAPLSVTAGEGPRVAEHEVHAAHAEMREALDGFHESPAQRVLARLLAAHSRLAVIRDVIIPYLHDVGERWAADHLTVAQEHFASTFLQVRLHAMARGWDRGTGPQALLACAAGERHVFGLLSFGIALHAFGWRITYLGADTPAGMVDAAAESVRPDLIVLSAVSPARFAGERPSLERLAVRWSCAIAGAGASAELAADLGARHLARDPVTSARDVYGT